MKNILKMMLFILFPLAAWLGIWAGFTAAGISLSPLQAAILIFFAVWTGAGTFVYFATERRRMNRNVNYR